MDWKTLKKKLIKEPDPKKKNMTFKEKVIDNIKGFGWALIVALLIKTFIIEATTVPTGSMEDTILPGDFLFINKFIYGATVPFINKKLPSLRKPRRGDIVVFKYPVDPSLNFVKRCVAVGGDTVQVINKNLYINGKFVPLPRYGKHSDNRIYPAEVTPRDNFGPFVVPANHYFMMGDNRDNSNDSRFWGPVPDSLIRGEALIIYWSWNKEIPFWEPIRKVSSIRWRRIGKFVH